MLGWRFNHYSLRKDMNEQKITTNTDELTGGDWTMAIISFLLTSLIPFLLSIYNFAKSRRSQGFLYLGVIGVQVLLLLIIKMVW